MEAESMDNSFLIKSKDDDYFNWVRTEEIYNNTYYKKLINWLSGEFNLYLQEESEDLKVYFPNGWFLIKLIEDMDTKYEIIVKCKCKNTIVQMYNQISSVVNHFKSFK
jgi:sRNA-binding regulator protein Hfq